MVGRLLAYADSTDQSATNIKLVLICAGILLVVVAVAFVPVAITWSRRHPKTEAITGLAVVWGLITAGSLAYSTTQQINWGQERLKRIYSGYYDPNDNSDTPKLPWLLWGGLAVGYVGLVAWGLSHKAPTAALPADDQSEPAS
jgi:multidrug efflux pump subunit AcrB